MRVSILIVNWNSKEYLRKCLEKLQQSDLSGVDLETIVVDSGSFDGSEAMVQAGFPWVKYVQSPTNLGFAKANNLAADHASGEYFLFLNPDTEVAPDAVRALCVEGVKLPRLGILGPRLLNTDGSLQTSCVQPMPTIFNQVLDIDFLLKPLARFPTWLNAQTFEGTTRPVSVPAVSGACMLMPRAVFREVEGFSTDYFMYAEDIDLCWKVRRAGYENYYYAPADIVHHGGGSTRKTRNKFAEIMIPQSLSRLLRKARGSAYSLAYRIVMTLSAAGRVVVLLLLFPLVAAVFGLGKWTMMISKWAAVFRWGIGLERWARQQGAT